MDERSRMEAQKPLFTYLDLEPFANQKLTESRGNQGNHLASLPKGERVFEDIGFKIGDGLVQLVGTADYYLPDKVEGIPVGTTFRKLHILHACHHTAWNDAIIGYYTVHYEDESQETIPIVYGKDILDWWYTETSPTPTRARVAWSGSNSDVKAWGGDIRLYLTTWKNPEPTQRVVSIDFGSTNSTRAAPFCVAMTLEK